MIPTEAQAKALWDTYHLPESKRIHVSLVSRVAIFLAKEIQNHEQDIHINIPLIQAAALLHDIDKAILKLPGEHHPDTGVRILIDEGMSEVAAIVRTHPLHSIVDPSIAPSSWEEKVVYLADKMVKHDVVGVDGRFALWRAENLPENARMMLDTTYPKVKTLEKEVFDLIGVDSSQLALLV
jgi:uncharacterized protein